MTSQIALYANQPGVLAWWIRLRTGEYSHAAWAPEGADGPIWEATYPKIRRAATLKETTKPGTRVDLYDLINLQEWQRQRITTFFQDHEGERYDILGLLGFMRTRDIQSEHAWFCSEAVHDACNAAAYWLFDAPHNAKPWKTSPTMISTSAKTKLSRSITF